MDGPTKPSNNPFMTSTATASTTYVQADAATFRDLVQRLTGASAADPPDKLLPVAARPSVGPRRAAFKLQDRRWPSVRNLEVQLGLASLRPSRASPRSPSLHHHHQHSNSISSPVTPLGSDQLFSPASEEERVIAEKGFYLHPSPRFTSEPPELLPLFPLSSPKQQQQYSRPGRDEE